MKKFLGPPNHKLSFDKNVHRMDPIPPYIVEPTLQMNQMEDFPKDFFPTLSKKYSQPPSHVYKHVYVSDKYVPKKNKKKKKEKEKEESWYESFSPFGDESEDDDEKDYEYEE